MTRSEAAAIANRASVQAMLNAVEDFMSRPRDYASLARNFRHMHGYACPPELSAEIAKHTSGFECGGGLSSDEQAIAREMKRSNRIANKGE